MHARNRERWLGAPFSVHGLPSSQSAPTGTRGRLGQSGLRPSQSACSLQPSLEPSRHGVPGGSGSQNLQHSSLSSHAYGDAHAARGASGSSSGSSSGDGVVACSGTLIVMGLPSSAAFGTPFGPMLEP